MIRFQKEGFSEDYNRTLNGLVSKTIYVDPDSVKFIRTSFYNLLTEFLQKREQEFGKGFLYIPPQLAKLSNKNGMRHESRDDYKIFVIENEETQFRLTSDQFGFSAAEGIYSKPEKYPLAKINYLSKESQSEDREEVIKKLINYVENTRTLGGVFVWPIPKEGRRNCSYNIRRGIASYIEDRVDLTLLEIKHALDGEYKKKHQTDILYNLYHNNTQNIRNWLEHFDSFDEYIRYFMLTDFVEDGMPINIMTGNPLCDEEIKSYKESKPFQDRDLSLKELLSILERLESMIVKRTHRMEYYISDYIKDHRDKIESCNYYLKQ